jgi:hypothetical protein
LFLVVPCVYLLYILLIMPFLVSIICPFFLRGQMLHHAVPCDYLLSLISFLYRPKRFTLKQSKQFWFTCRDLHLTLYKSREEAAQGAEPVHHINLRGCEVTPEVNITQGRYGIKLEVPSAEGMTEMFIRCNTVSTACIFCWVHWVTV